ncbi:putative secondary metabolism biosynthetic enzyme [Trichoderma atroviride]|uniref:putative secondary metabolism biosynthetic enzyme n=1 Tax=Hypocrea atroviridis TaxID=63577 RepID=UPI00332AE0B4|nr:putative secondary metabolism biosynthetic enzyme [Trichoderma atroviride]
MRDLYLMAEEECQVSQDVETFYKDFQSIGLEYGPSFQSLKDIRYDTHGKSYCTIEIVDNGSIPAVLPAARPHVIHTTTLHGAIQAAVASFKGDDGNIKGYLAESFVEEIVVEADIPFKSGVRFKGCARLLQQNSSEAISDIFMLDDKTGQRVISIKGLRFVVDAVSRTQRNGDPMSLRASPFTCKMHWIPAFDLLSPGKKQETIDQIDKPNDEEVRDLMKEQQIAYVAIREAIEKANGMRIPNLQLRNFAKWMKQQLNASLFPLEKHMSANNKLRKSLTEVLGASVDPESLLGTEKSVDKIVHSLCGMRISQRKLIKVVATMAQIKPNLAILELGADYTSPFLASAGGIPDTVNYTYTCPNVIGLQEVKDSSHAFLIPSQLKVLDIDLDIRKQGFEPSSYDIIIGCNVFSNAKSLQRTMANLKSLLKDGGKICLAELTNPGPTVLPVLGGIYEWWKKRDDGSSRPLKLDSIQSVFNDHHFGIDFISSDFDASPLHQTSVVFASATRPRDEVTILQAANCSKVAQELASKVSQLLQNDGISSRVCAWGSDDIDYKGKRFIALVEFELPFLENLMQRDFEVLQRLATEAASLQWVTALPDPERSSSLGFARVVRNEIPAIRFQTLQLDTGCVTMLDRAAALIYQVESSTTTENEFREVDGVLRVPRVIENRELNERLSQKSPDLSTVELIPLGSTTGSQKLFIRNDGVSEPPYFEVDELRNNDLDKDEIEIGIKASALSRRDVIHQIGPASDAALDLEASGIVLRVGEQVTQFQAGDFVFAIVPGTHRTVLRANASMCQRIPTGINFEDAACLSLANCTAYHALVNIACIREGQSILIHDAASNVGQAAVQLAKHKGLDVFATTRSASEREVLKDVYSIANDCIFSLRDSKFSNGILRMTNGTGVDYVLNSSVGDQLQETWNCLASCGTFLEISTKNTSRSTLREMRPPLKDYIFASVNMGHIQSQRPEIMAGILRNTFELMEQGIVKPTVPVTVYPVSQIERAMHFMKSTENENLESIALSFSADDLIPVLCKPKNTSLKLSGDSTYLIVGGLGDLGRSLARFLVGSGARHICFISRSGAVQDVQKQLVTDLASSGVGVQVYKCDIASFSALKDTLALCSQEMPPISGVIHSALVLRDAILHNMTYTQWVEAVGPKLQGSRNLNELLPRNLDFFVALGSFISVIGGRSQSNYAFGGAYQDGLADFRRSLGLRAVTINLGVVKDIGIIARNGAVGAARDWAEAFGLDEYELHTLVEHAISGQQQIESSYSIPAQIITGIPTIGMVKEAGIPRPYYFDDPKFSILASMGAKQTPLIAKNEDILPSSLSLGEQLKGVTSIADASKLVLDALVAEVAKLMQVDTGEIDTNKALYSHGVDSLIAVDMAHWIKKEIGADVVLSDITATIPITSFAKDITAKSKFSWKN